MRQGRHWVLDPIDGTRGFVGMRQYAVCLGLLDQGQVATLPQAPCTLMGAHRKPENPDHNCVDIKRCICPKPVQQGMDVRTLFQGCLQERSRKLLCWERIRCFRDANYHRARVNTNFPQVVVGVLGCPNLPAGQIEDADGAGNSAAKAGTDGVGVIFAARKGAGAFAGPLAGAPLFCCSTFQVVHLSG